MEAKRSLFAAGARLLNTARFAGALTATNLRASVALRGAFLLQAAFMVLNNVTFFLIWVLFFERFDSIGGWKLDDMRLLFGVSAGGLGLAVVFGGGIDTLARAIAEGELDPVLVQPKHPLLQQLASKSRASGWGDFATGVLFLGIGGALSPGQLPVAVLAVLASATVFLSAGVVFHSLAFWLGRVETLARHADEFTLTFSLYPRPLFSGAVSFLLFTVIPAGFVSYLPADLIRDPDAALLLAVAGGAVTFALIAGAVFSLGLRQYESGNSFGAR